jgi:hypothetical protein
VRTKRGEFSMGIIFLSEVIKASHAFTTRGGTGGLQLLGLSGGTAGCDTWRNVVG